MRTAEGHDGRIQIRRAEERGRTQWGWLDSRHTFSFGAYDDPDHMGFRALRVYGQQAFDRELAGRAFVLLASEDGRDGSLQIQQDASVWMALIGDGERRELPLVSGRAAWVHVARGSVSVDGADLREGDGAAVGGEDRLRFLGRENAEVLVFDLG
jgi:redox-sensitive bicupin YhaK (pirin superfamily)